MTVNEKYHLRRWSPSTVCVLDQDWQRFQSPSHSLKCKNVNVYKQKCPNHDPFDNHHHPDTLVLEWHYQALPLPSSSAPPRQSGSDGEAMTMMMTIVMAIVILTIMMITMITMTIVMAIVIYNDDYGTISPAQYYHETPLNRSSQCKGDPSLRSNYSNLKISDSMPMLIFFIIWFFHV